jgi:O-antigen ligase
LAVMFFLRFKELIVVVAIAATIFYLAKPIALRFIAAEDFSRRRLVWFFLTAVSFLSPNIWLYAIVAIPVIIWISRKDSNPIGLYVLILHVIPPVDVIIPVIGNNGLFPLNNYRLLSLFLLIPVALRYRRNRGQTPSVFGAMDVLLLALGALEVALYVPPDLPHHMVIPDSPSNELRRAVLFMLDTYVLYYAVSRTCQTRQKILDVAASFCLASAVMAAIALFEYARSWLLYVDLARLWGANPNIGFYLTRNGSVRAQVSAGHALALGFLLAVASGFWLYLKSQVPSRIQRVGVTLLLWGGLLAAYSRGPWLGAVAIYFTFNAAGPRALSRFVKGLCAAVVIAGVVAISPLGDRIREMVPALGGTTDFNILYRQRLADRGWQLVMAHPLFGNQFPYPEMEDLRQGEGIIDIVNTYLGVALNYGLVGLTLFVGFMLLGIMKTYSRVRELARTDPELALFGASLIACIVGALVMIQSNSFNLGLQRMFYVLAGLATAYTQLDKLKRHKSTVVGASTALGG